MDTKELIAFLKVGLYNLDYTNPERCKHFKDAEQEIGQKLLEYGELKKMFTQVVDPLIDVCEFLIADFGEE